MKKIIVVIFLIVISATGVYLFVRHQLPDVIADTLMAEKPPTYLPDRVKKKIKVLKAPVNNGAEKVVKELHEADIPLENFLTLIDSLTEAQAYKILDELNQTELRNTDQVFDIAKKHFPAFDMEVFRKTFKENVSFETIQKGLQYANVNRQRKDVDFETAKQIAKKILIKKHKLLVSNQ